MSLCYQFQGKLGRTCLPRTLNRWRSMNGMWDKWRWNVQKFTYHLTIKGVAILEYQGISPIICCLNSWGLIYQFCGSVGKHLSTTRVHTNMTPYKENLIVFFEISCRDDNFKGNVQRLHFMKRRQTAKVPRRLRCQQFQPLLAYGRCISSFSLATKELSKGVTAVTHIAKYS